MTHIWKVTVYRTDDGYDYYNITAKDDQEARERALKMAVASITEVKFCEIEHLLELD